MRWGRRRTAGAAAIGAAVVALMISQLGTASAVGGPRGAARDAARSAGAAASTTGSTPSDDDSTNTDLPGWNLAWSDEFRGTAGSGPDSSKWVFDTGGEPNWGNQEWQYYTKRRENVSLDGKGHLVITARREKLPGMENCEYGTCDITSGRITTKGKFSQKYGRIEARLRIPAGQGFWPAFWMLGANDDRTEWPDCGELDIMEAVGSRTREVEGTAWGKNYPDSGIGGSTTVSASLADSFHRFAVEWSSGRITWFVDDKAYYTLTRDKLPRGAGWPFEQRFYLLLNLAVGGEMPKSPDSTTPFPSSLSVDYVRAYTKA